MIFSASYSVGEGVKSMGFELLNESKRLPKMSPTIKVIGVGGAGNNAVNRMVESGIHGVEFVAVNTDLQVLEACKAEKKVQIGKNITRGLGAGGRPDIGEQAALESEEEIREVLQDTDMLFVTAGLGGGTGTGAAPVIARLAKEIGALTVAVVTTPFYFEGNARWRVAIDGLKKLRENVDTLIKISNNKLLSEYEADLPVVEAFMKADETLHQGIKGISELITKRGYINLDFADVDSVMRGAGAAMLGIGVGKGENRAFEAAKKAMNSKLLEHPVDNASAIILNVSAPRNVTLKEMHLAASVIRQSCSDDVDVKFGLIIDDSIPEDEMRVTLIATGYELDESFYMSEEEIPTVLKLGLADFISKSSTSQNLEGEKNHGVEENVQEDWRSAD
ncbi:MAG: cell division protein FtsZ [Thermotogota bacterium]|nr:cell division protein FtsZ [Thermotogota bacterium]